jgi:pyridoxamine 5'-phosphate oxidase
VSTLLPPPAPSFDDPIGMLVACHVRMRRQLATLERLERHVPEHGADEEARAAAAAILKYFDHAGQNHHADEDCSVLPRVLERAPDLAGVIAGIGTDHAVLEGHWGILRPLLRAIAEGREEGLPPELVRTVCEGYVAHLDHEEAHLFPAALKCLDADALARIGREFAARRGIDADEPRGPSGGRR